MSEFLYPTAAELYEIEQSLLPVLIEDDPIFQIMPVRESDTDLVMWEQKDNYTGLAAARSLNAPAQQIPRVGRKRFRMEPGYYAEYSEIREDDLTRRRKDGTFNVPIDISDLVREEQDHLLHRRINRLRYILWTLITSGTFSVAGPDGQVLHQDTYSVQTYSASVPWSTSATATPLADFRAIQLKQRGYSVDFGRAAMAVMNRQTWNYLIANTNAADLFGRRTTGLATFENVEEVNKLLAGDDLPQIVIYDEGWESEAGVWTPFIPLNKVAVIGVRKDRQKIGGYQYTRNASHPDMAPKPFTMVVDSIDKGEPIPRRIQVFDSHNGGPVLEYPSAIVVATVS